MFRDRIEAGCRLADALAPYAREDCLILALPRGGVPVAAEIARKLDKPLDVLVVRKVGAPLNPELAIGAVAPNNVLILNEDLLRALGIGPDSLEHAVVRERAELERRQRRFRGNRPFPDIRDKTVILVDDGLATGASARAAIAAARALGARKIVLAIPTGARSTVSLMRHEVDDLVCLEAPDEFQAVSLHYRDFPQNSDTEVIHLLEAAWGNPQGTHNTMAHGIGPP